MRVLHVTESFASGVLSFIDDLTRKQAQEGLETHVLYCLRPDSPSRHETEQRFEPSVVLHDPIDGSPEPLKLMMLAKQIRHQMRQYDFDAVHLHSSRAGVIGRLVLGRHRHRTFYSPHGFAFLRGSSSRTSRAVARSIERALAPCGSMVVTSASEVTIARKVLKARSVHYLRSGVPSETIRRRPATSNSKPRVITMARMVYQKAPGRFARIARELADIADFVWIGGDPAGTARWIGDAPVTVIGWLPKPELDAMIESSDIMLFPTLWEGFSLALVQAQAGGLPAVTSDVVGNRDAVANGITGYVCTSEEEMIEATRRLILNADLRASMGVAAQERVRNEFVNDDMGRDSRAIYTAGSMSGRGTAVPEGAE